MSKKIIGPIFVIKQRTKRGQAIVEYGAILAFVAVIISLTLAFVKGNLGPTVENSYSSMTSQLNRLDAGST